MRIISQKSPIYDGSGYHFGAVWPLFTGWASVGEYRYHRAFPAYFNLRSNALLAFDGSLGHFTEVLSGDYNQSFATSSPQQIWSAAMVISPILRGMFGLQIDARKSEVSFAPHVPASWTWFAIRNVHGGGAFAVDFAYQKSVDHMVLAAKRTGTGDCWIDFSPALSLRTEVTGVSLDGKSVQFKVEPNRNDKHLHVRFRLGNSAATLSVKLRGDFGLALPNELPPLGSASRNLRIISETWNAARTELTLHTSGLTGNSYELDVQNPAPILSAQGGDISEPGKLKIQMPEGTAGSYTDKNVVLHFRQP
jgi:hypothetical protein